MYHALPNKLFEYVFAGIPQVSSDGLEIQKIFNLHKIGLIFDAYSPEDFARSVKEILENSVYKAIKEAIVHYKESLCRENDFDNL